LLAELERADELMTRYAEIDESAAKETAAEMLKPGSGITEIVCRFGNK
jgi:hypothetical protein